jgi:putative FmdB family regulatory protein
VPLYDYDCANCGQRFEVLRGVHSDEPTACPLCGGGPIKKAFATPAIHFKGSGWAKKERRATSSPGASKAAGDGSGSGSGSSGESGASGSEGVAASTSSSNGSDGSSASDGGDGGGSSSKGSDASKKATSSSGKAKGD